MDKKSQLLAGIMGGACTPMIIHDPIAFLVAVLIFCTLAFLFCVALPWAFNKMFRRM